MRRSCQEAKVRGEGAGDGGEEGEALLLQGHGDDCGPVLSEVVATRAEGLTVPSGWPVPEQGHVTGVERVGADA
eukprot:2356187-Heterocapsa_arctica.AAC.1